MCGVGGGLKRRRESRDYLAFNLPGPFSRTPCQQVLPLPGRKARIVVHTQRDLRATEIWGEPQQRRSPKNDSQDSVRCGCRAVTRYRCRCRCEDDHGHDHQERLRAELGDRRAGRHRVVHQQRHIVHQVTSITRRGIPSRWSAFVARGERGQQQPSPRQLCTPSLAATAAMTSAAAGLPTTSRGARSQGGRQGARSRGRRRSCSGLPR